MWQLCEPSRWIWQGQQRSECGHTWTHSHTPTHPPHAYSCCDNKVELGASVNCFPWQLLLFFSRCRCRCHCCCCCCCRWLYLCRCLATADVLIESAQWRSMPKNTQKEVVNFLAVVQGIWWRRDTHRDGAGRFIIRPVVYVMLFQQGTHTWARLDEQPLSNRSISFSMCQANFRRKTQVLGSTCHYPDARPDPTDAKWNGFWSNENQNCMHLICPKKELYFIASSWNSIESPSKSDNRKSLCALFIVLCWFMRPAEHLLPLKRIADWQISG